MDFNHFKQNKKKKAANTDNFIEAIKGIGGGVIKSVAKDVVAGTAQNIAQTILTGPQLSGDLEPGKSVEFDQLQQEKQAEQLAKSEHRHLHQLRQKEETIFSAREEQAQKEILQLQEELKQLASQLGDVAREVKVATIQETVNPGKYHVGFFEHLKRIIKTLRQTLSDSASWLHTANKRADHKKGYWGKFKKHGTQFSMSEERKMATSSG